MGFAGVYNGHNLPDIWELFNATKGKNIDAYRWHLYARMKQYAYDRRIQINTSIYREQETIKAIVELQFNPGEGVAHLASASRGSPFLHAVRKQRKKQRGSVNRKWHYLRRRRHVY